MAPTKSALWKKCVTCKFWMGPRQLSSYPGRVAYESEHDLGPCSAPENALDETAALGTCYLWARWDALK